MVLMAVSEMVHRFMCVYELLSQLLSREIVVSSYSYQPTVDMIRLAETFNIKLYTQHTVSACPTII